MAALMGRPKKARAENTPEPASPFASSDESTATQAAVDSPPKQGRISLPLNDDGTFDFSSVRPTTQEKFYNAVKSDPEVMQKIGLGPADDDGVNVFGGISLENMRATLDMLTKVNGIGFKMLAGRFIKHPFKKDAKTGKPLPFTFDPELIDQHFILTEEQHRELDPRATRLANKYSPEFLKKNSDVIALVGMYLMYMSQNAAAVLQAQATRDLTEFQQRAQAQAAQQAKKGNGAAPTWADPSENTTFVPKWPDASEATA